MNLIGYLSGAITMLCLIVGLNCFGQYNYKRIFHLIDSADYAYAAPGDLILIDSTLSHYHESKNDTVRVDLLNHIVNNCYNDLVWPAYNKILYNETKRLFSDAKMVNPEWSFKVASLHANAINNMGYLEYYQGNIEGALIYYQESMDISERIKDSLSISMCLNNMGGVFFGSGDYQKSIDYFKKSLAIKNVHGQPSEIALSLSNIGSTYNHIGMLDSALLYYDKALAIYERINDTEGLALCYHNLASLNSKMGNHDLANLFFLKSIRLSEQISDFAMVSNSYLLLSKLCFESADIVNAEIYGLRSLEFAKKLGFPAEIRDASEVLLNIYRKKGEVIKALDMYDLFVQMKDSVISENTVRELENRELSYAFEKKMLADSLKHVEENKVNQALIEHKDARIRADRILKISLSGGVLLLIGIALLILISLRNSRRSKKEIGMQKELLEEKNREILDSINYAKRLQEGILPSRNTVTTLLPESFVMYLPKDIVAGDFYWIEKVDDCVYFAVGDCTGHGVPGAFVSIICSNALSSTILENGKIQPHELLEKTTEKVVAAFNKSDHQIKDGMDIALCMLNTTSLHLSYSGAYNPLWIVSERVQLDIATQVFENGHEKTLHEIKATKQPVGKYTFRKPFELHSLQLKPGEQIYILSDGYADQFGGEKGKKLKYKNLKSMILAYSHQTMPQQQASLHEAFFKWKGDFEQVDDVCILGIRV